jgi:dolichyl-phosphate-mannose-protein mannosyltransferase
MLRKVLDLKIILFLVLVFLGLLSRFLFIWYPPQVVFDEVHFGKFVSAYFSGEYYFDIHPPLGKLLIAGFAKFFGFHSGFSFETIGLSYGDIPYVALRFLPNLAGALIGAVVFGFVLALGGNPISAFVSGMAVLLDNAMLTQSHFILVDSFLILFGFLGLYFFFRARSEGYNFLKIFFAALFCALSFSIKWTGLVFAGIAFFVMAWDLILKFYKGNKNILPNVASVLIFLIVPTILYTFIFWVHFLLLPYSGSGDAYMSPNFREKSFLGKMIELNKVMYTSNENLRASHPYSSPAWSWPLMLRPVFYWVGDFADGKKGRIYLLGNPVVWWGSSIGVLLSLLYWRPRNLQRKWILFAGYLSYMFPLFFVKRVLFMYHYLPALVFAIVITSEWLFGEENSSKNKIYFAALALFLIFIGFVFFAPLSYGLPLSDKEYKIRVWIQSWM